MKKIFLISFTTVLLLFTLACKKDTNNSASFFPAGFWRGNLTNEASVAMLNLPDGTSNFYAMLNSLDTSVAEEKFSGHYTMQNGVLKAILVAPAGQAGRIYDSLTLETVTTSPEAMTGIIIINQKFNDSTTGVLTPSFNLVRQ
jgi:hypothetical protein